MSTHEDGTLDREAWAAATGRVLNEMLDDVRTTTYWVHQETKLPYSTLIRYQRGERPPTLYAAVLICLALGVTVDHFLKRATAIYNEEEV